MDIYLTPRPTTLALLRLAAALHVAARSLAGFARRFDTWRTRRERVARDREMLALMSERDLRDIGVSAGYRDDVAAGRWTRG